MQKYTYQTCLRMSEVLKNSMTKICDTYQINESDFMRRAIAESVQSHIEKTQNPGRPRTPMENTFLYNHPG